MASFTARTPPPPNRGRSGPVIGTADAYRAGADGALTLDPTGGERRLARWLLLHHGATPILVGIAALSDDEDAAAWASRTSKALAESGRGTVHIDLTLPTRRATLSAVAAGRATLHDVGVMDTELPLTELAPGPDLAAACADLRLLEARLPDSVDVMVLALPRDPQATEIALGALNRLVVLAAAGHTDRDDLDAVVGRYAGTVAVDVAVVGEVERGAHPPQGADASPTPWWERLGVNREAGPDEHDEPRATATGSVLRPAAPLGPDEGSDTGAGPDRTPAALEWRGAVQPAAHKQHTVTPDQIWTRTDERERPADS